MAGGKSSTCQQQLHGHGLEWINPSLVTENKKREREKERDDDNDYDEADVVENKNKPSNNWLEPNDG